MAVVMTNKKPFFRSLKEGLEKTRYARKEALDKYLDRHSARNNRLRRLSFKPQGFYEVIKFFIRAPFLFFKYMLGVSSAFIFLFEFAGSDKKRRLHSPPGSFSIKVLSFIFSKKAYKEVFSQVIADMREEYAEALLNNEHRKARWIVIRDHLTLILTVAAYIVSTVGKKVIQIWRLGS